MTAEHHLPDFVRHGFNIFIRHGLPGESAGYAVVEKDDEADILPDDDAAVEVARSLGIRFDDPDDPYRVTNLPEVMAKFMAIYTLTIEVRYDIVGVAEERKAAVRNALFQRMERIARAVSGELEPGSIIGPTINDYDWEVKVK